MYDTLDLTDIKKISYGQNKQSLTRPSLITGLLSPKANLAVSRQNSGVPPMGAYSLSKFPPIKACSACSNKNNTGEPARIS